jgi:zinc protease
MRSLPRLLVTLILLVLAAPHGSCQFGDIRETVLDNGLTVLTREVHFAPLVAVHIFYNVGSRNEHAGITGLSHFCEHLDYRGTMEFGAREVDRMLAEIGSPESNGYTWLDSTSYYAKVPAEHVDLVLRAEASRMHDCLYLPEDVEAERTVVLSEMEGDYNDPTQRLDEETWAAAFKAHPYGHPILGWRSDVEGVTRREALDYYHTYYAPNNAVLVIVGDFDTDAIIAKVKERFGSIPRGPDPPPVRTVEPKQRGERRVITKAAAASPQIRILYHAPPTSHPDHIVLDVVAGLLSTGRSGRLDTQVTDAGLATEVSAWNADLKDPAAFVIGATLPEDGDVDACLDAITRVVSELGETPVTEEELARDRKHVRASFVLTNESITKQAEMIGDYHVAAGYQYVTTYLERVAAVTADDIMRAVKTYLTEDNCTIGILVPSGEAPAVMCSGQAMAKAAHHRDRVAIAPLCIAQSPAGSPAAQPVRKVFPNGLTAIVCENHANPSVTIAALMRAGAIYDARDRPGLARFVARCLDDGTSTRDADQLGREIDSLGAVLEFASRTETANCAGFALSEDFEQILGIAGDCLMNPVFPEDRIERAREDLLTQLAAKQEDTYWTALLAAQRMMYPPDHPYYHDPDGTSECLAAVTREDLIAFHRKCYRPDTTVISVVGDVKREQAFAAIEKVFGGWAAAGEPPRVALPDIRALPEDRVTRVNLPDKTQADFVVAAPGLKRSDPDYYAAQIANTILGGSGVSRIDEEVREKRGLAYYAYSYFDPGTGQGCIYAGAGTNPTATDEALRITRQEVARAAGGDFTDDELRRAKAQWLGWTINALDTNRAIAEAYCTTEYYGLGLDYIHRLPEIVAALTKEQIVDAARKYFGAKCWAVAIAGPPAGSESEQ